MKIGLSEKIGFVKRPNLKSCFINMIVVWLEFALIWFCDSLYFAQFNLLYNSISTFRHSLSSDTEFKKELASKENNNIVLNHSLI